jgi:hypothetical protein
MKTLPTAYSPIEIKIGKSEKERRIYPPPRYTLHNREKI